MEEYWEALKDCALFAGISAADFTEILDCLNAKIRHYGKGGIIFTTEDEITSIGILLSGNVQIIKEDYSGNRNILAELSVSEIFAEVFVCAGIKKSPVTVLSTAGCSIMLLDYCRIINICPSACDFHAKLLANMLRLMANKNLLLNQKIEYLSKRSTREKLLSYLNAQAEKANSRHFSIPFTRQALADYLCVDRSAMSRELCRLRDAGVLRFHGNQFEL